MSYGKRKKKQSFVWGSTLGTGVLVLGLFIVFVIAVGWFRSSKPEPVEKTIDSIAEVMKPDPISQAVINGAIDKESKEARMRLVASQADIGFVKRGTKDDKYFLESELTLPEIDREAWFYEVWLVRQIPYGFFSVGEMVTNDDGVFVIEWQAAEEDEDYSDYSDIVVTLQEYGGSTDPQRHVSEGVFGK